MNAFALAALFLSMPSATARVEPWPLPVSGPAAQPSLSLGNDGAINLTWIERAGDGHRLRIARFRDGRWSDPNTVAQGRDWFVNWADFPSSTQLADGSLWAHTLVKRAAGAYAYDLALYRSYDKGRSWSRPVTVNADGTDTEHGFATLWPWSKTELAVAWLDGRQTAGNAPHAGHAEGHGADLRTAMTLRAATFNSQGLKTREWALDTSTCDCCQTDSALTADGPIVVYRDRSAGEIRDIFSARYRAGKWQTPAPVAVDGWRMPACPVNGPAVAASGTQVWVAWYTGADNRPRIRLAHSGNAGADFGATRDFRQGDEIQGRVDLSADDDGAWLLWTEERDRQTLWLQRVDRGLRPVGAPRRIASLQGRGRATGFARMLRAQDGLHVVWTDVVSGKPVLRGARVPVAH